MAPTIHVIRHAEALHNATDNYEIHDPELTELGYQQCEALAAELADLGEVELVFASPLQRAIQTALATFKNYSKHIALLPDLQEYDLLPPSIGSSPDELFQKYGPDRLDYSFLAQDWTDKSPHSRYAPKFTAARARSARLFLRSVAQKYRDTDANIFVVSHGLFIGYLTASDGNMFKNTEYRSYHFEQLAGDDIQAKLIETPGSIDRRRKAAAAPRPELSPFFGANLPPIVAEAHLTNKMPGTVPTLTSQLPVEMHHNEEPEQLPTPEPEPFQNTSSWWTTPAPDS
ncbi:histidine phosphatase superfamily [Xylaria cf. heliscus]|nr:histidine phosphatase superfamily [Xylaria cf. heliscus]